MYTPYELVNSASTRVYLESQEQSEHSMYVLHATATLLSRSIGVSNANLAQTTQFTMLLNLC